MNVDVSRAGWLFQGEDCRVKGAGYFFKTRIVVAIWAWLFQGEDGCFKVRVTVSM